MGFINEGKHHSVSFSCDWELVMRAIAPHVQYLPYVLQEAIYPTVGIPFARKAVGGLS
jgi:hypothetical protein